MEMSTNGPDLAFATQSLSEDSVDASHIQEEAQIVSYRTLADTEGCLERTTVILAKRW